jgi:hypothetical protein
MISWSTFSFLRSLVTVSRLRWSRKSFLFWLAKSRSCYPWSVVVLRLCKNITTNEVRRNMSNSCSASTWLFVVHGRFHLSATSSYRCISCHFSKVSITFGGDVWSIVNSFACSTWATNSRWWRLVTKAWLSKIRHIKIYFKKTLRLMMYRVSLVMIYQFLAVLFSLSSLLNSL